jgi:hypothetical protein
MSVMYIYNNFIADKKGNSTNKATVEYGAANENSKANYSSNQSIDQLTEEKTIINYVKQNHQLPDFYITKNEARKSGWNPSKGNLCDVLPGKAIGGDYFSNREGNLPKGEKYFEADVNYNCGNRNADRIVFTKNGDVYLSKNHYKSFEKQ